MIKEKSFADSYAAWCVVNDEVFGKWSGRTDRADCPSCSEGVQCLAIDANMKLSTYQKVSKLDLGPLRPSRMFLAHAELQKHVSLLDGVGGKDFPVRHTTHLPDVSTRALG